MLKIRAFRQLKIILSKPIKLYWSSGKSQACTYIGCHLILSKCKFKKRCFLSPAGNHIQVHLD